MSVEAPNEHRFQGLEDRTLKRELKRSETPFSVYLSEEVTQVLSQRQEMSPETPKQETAWVSSTQSEDTMGMILDEAQAQKSPVALRFLGRRICDSSRDYPVALP